MEPLARIKDCPSVTAASAAITPLEERVSASSPESVGLQRWGAPPSSGDGDHQCGRDADTNDHTLEEHPPAWGEQASSYRPKTQCRKPASLLAGKGRQHGGGQRTTRSTLLLLRIRAAAQTPLGAGKLRTPVALPESRSAAEALMNALTRELDQSQWLTLQRAADPLLMSAALAERSDPRGVSDRQKWRSPRRREPQPLPAPVRQERGTEVTQWIYRFHGDEGEFVQIQAANDEGGYRLIPSSHQVRDRLTAHLPGAPSGVRLMNVPTAPPPLPEAPT